MVGLLPAALGESLTELKKSQRSYQLHWMGLLPTVLEGSLGYYQLQWGVSGLFTAMYQLYFVALLPSALGGGFSGISTASYQLYWVGLLPTALGESLDFLPLTLVSLLLSTIVMILFYKP